MVRYTANMRRSMIVKVTFKSLDLRFRLINVCLFDMLRLLKRYAGNFCQTIAAITAKTCRQKVPIFSDSLCVVN